VSDSAWPPRLDGSETLLGRLQRGLGSAAREVLDSGAPDARELVRACLEADPRWDTDLDDRADYYAVLAISTGLDVADVAALAADKPRGDGPDQGPSPVLGVLARMAARGNAEAITALRRYFASGRYWERVISWLMPDGWPDGTARGWPECVEGLAPLLCERFPTVEQMGEALKDAWSVRLEDAPWSEWQSAFPLLGSAFKATAEDHKRPSAASDCYANASTSALLALEKPELARRVAKWLAPRTSRDDVRLMLRAAKDRSLAMHAAAVNALAIQQRSEVLPAVLELSDQTGRGITRALLFGALTALPYKATRAPATGWLTGSDRTRRAAAASAMAAHAIDDDVRLITVELSRELDRRLDGDQYVVCSLAEALGRHPAHGPFQELDRAFRAMPYSFGRHYVIEAIAATDPDFPDELAIESLWDCEPAVRATAAQHARRAHPIAAARLQQIRSDPLEDKDVRAAAT
jgi:hypothetical protein